MNALLRVVALLALCSCAVDTQDEGEAETESDLQAADRIQIGFNGPTDQMEFIDAFVASESKRPAKVLCHTYISWHSAEDRGPLEDYLKKAQGHCDDVLLSFKAMNPQAIPSAKTYAGALDRFFAIEWKKNTGFTGHLSFTAWNEVDNPADDGNGLGKEVPPETAARYFLSLAMRCKKHDCTAVAGDFASNGNMWLHYDDRNGSYIDRYKDTIEKEADGYQGLGKSYRPDVFALHGWHDVNMYISEGNHAKTEETSVMRKLLRSLDGSWKNVRIWDTETGVGQKGALNDGEQACAAAFLIQNHRLASRIDRMYVTRLHRGTLSLYDGKNPRPAATILAQRATSVKGRNCK